jgi:hypothetical protein
MIVYSVGEHRLREKFDVTDSDVLYRLSHSCLHLADIVQEFQMRVAIGQIQVCSSLFCSFCFHLRSVFHFHRSHVVFLLASTRSPPLTLSLHLRTSMHNTSAVCDQLNKSFQSEPYHNPTLLSPY